MKRSFNFLKKNPDISTLTLCCIFILASIPVSLNRFWQYEMFYYDLGIFDRAIWLVSQFKPPVIDHLVVGGKLIFADHFSPSIFIFSPLFWLTHRAEILLIAQSIAVGISGLFIYKIGKIVTKNHLFSLAILTSYYLFVGLQNAIISDFHEVTAATPFVAACIYFFLRNKKFLSFVFFLVSLGFKESNFLLGAGLAIAFFLLDKTWRKFSVFLLAFSIVWGIIAIKIIIPYFSGGTYAYGIEFSPDKINLITDLLGNPAKRQTIFYSLMSFSFLPILSPIFWPLIIQDFLVRFLSGRVSLGLHYSSLLSVILAVSSFYGFSILNKIKFIRKHLAIFSLLIILNSLFLYRFVLRGPLGLSYNPAFYSHTKGFKFLDDLVSQIPVNASVGTQNNLATRFTHNNNVWILRENYDYNKPDYILMDLRTGQNVNNFFLTKNPEVILRNLLSDKNYTAIYNNGNQYIFKRKNETL